MEAIERVSPMDLRVPYSMFSDELSGLYGSTVLAEMAEIIRYYGVYDKGAKFLSEGTNGDYKPSNLPFKQAAALINKEARFLFSSTPDMFVKVPLDTGNKDQLKAANTVLQNLVNQVLEANHFESKLLKAAKDCFIGKRVAYFVNFDEVKQTIKVNFIPSLEFVYETSEDDSDILEKLVVFYTVVDSRTKEDQRIYKKKYWMQNGLCWINEGTYNGYGTLMEETIADRATKFSYIPAGVIVNDGLTGDLMGESEINLVGDYESWYSRLANADMDAERQNMNPIRWTRDMSPESTKGLSIAPGALWDLSTDQNSAEGATGEIGILETGMSYSGALGSTLERILNGMHSMLDMPNVSPDALKGVVSSGKTLKAIYWGLTVRCDEKMLTWRPALKHILQIIIEGSKLYPQAAKTYIAETVPTVNYVLEVENQYPLPEDEAEEKATDLAEVASQTMSKKSYMKKWRSLTDDEADAEIEQMAKEREVLDDTFAAVPTGSGVPGEGGLTDGSAEAGQ